MSPELLREYDAEGRVVRTTVLNPGLLVTVYSYDLPDDLTAAEEPTEQDAPAPDDPPRETE